MAEELSEEELKRLKREAAIRSKENEYDKKLKEEEERKREQLQELKEQYETAEQRRVEEQLKALKRQTELRAQRQKEREKANRKREGKIKLREADWAQRASVKIQQHVQEKEAERQQAAQALEEARSRKNDKDGLAAAERLEAKERQRDLEEKRQRNIEARGLQTELRAIRRADEVKKEAQEELHSFIQHPAPVPLKQVLAGRLRAVPRVTEMLAAWRDQKESLEDFRNENVALRAVIRNEALFHHVLNIRKDFEAHRIKPPEPIPSDTGRGARGGSPKKPRGKENNPGMSQTGKSWKSKSGSPLGRSTA
jgi:chromosome segregation ATPase